jgi:predicted permease
VSDRASAWLRVALHLVDVAALLAPGGDRARWRRQWAADLTCHWHHLERASRATPAAGRALVGRAAGAWVHALWLRSRSWRLEMLLTDLRLAMRLLLVRRPLFTALATATLAIGIAANAVIYSWVDGLLLNPLRGVADQHRLAVVTVTTASRDGLSFSYPNYVDVRAARGGAYTDLAVFGSAAMSLRTDRVPERVWGQLFSGNMFDLLGVQPALGRLLTEEDDRAPGGEPVAVLAHAFWQRQFGGRASVIGETLVLNNRAFTIVGVTPPAFQGTQGALAFDVFVPLSMQAVFYAGDRLGDRGHGWLQAMARLAPDRSLADLQAALDVVAARLAASYPASNENRGLRAFPLWRSPNGGQSMLMPAFAVLAGIVGLLLLLVCTNMAGLLLARAAGRAREMAMRHALGANRSHLVRQLLVESLVLSFLGGGLGLLAARWSGALLRAFIPPLSIPIAIDAGLSWRVAIFTAIVSGLAGLVLGILPAWQASRTSVRDALQDGSGASSSWRRGRLRQGLVVAQVAVALVLLVAAGLFVRSMDQAYRMDAGFTTRQGVIGAFDVQSAGYDEARGRLAQARILEEVRAIPGVEAATLARRAPLNPTDSSDRSVEVEGYQPAPREEMSVFYNQVSAGFFETLGIPLREGRVFAASDASDAPRVIVISERMAQTYWRGRSAVGGRVRLADGWVTVIGVVADGKYGSMTESPRSFMYLPLAQYYRADVRLIVRTTGAPGDVVPALRSAMARVDPSIPLFDITTIAEHVAFSFFLFELLASLLGGFGIVATALAALGLYGVVAFSVAQRTREIGVRVSLGATRGDVLRLILRQACTLVGVGLVTGLVLAAGASRLMASQLVGVSPFDVPAYASTLLVVLGTTLVAATVPARAAMRLDPLTALRRE